MVGSERGQREELTMQESRDLDALLAEKVCGWRWVRLPATGSLLIVGPQDAAEYHPQLLCDRPAEILPHQVPMRLPRYSSDIAAAFLVVAKMRELGFIWELCHCIPLSIPPYGASFVSRSETVRDYEANRDMIERAFVLADTAPLAICLAALKALGTSSETSEGKR
jgi:hypothetical protein